MVPGVGGSDVRYIGWANFSLTHTVYAGTHEVELVFYHYLFRIAEVEVLQSMERS